ncbi:fucose-binding lectin II [Edaphobacter aggregans]
MQWLEQKTAQTNDYNDSIVVLNWPLT